MSDPVVGIDLGKTHIRSCLLSNGEFREKKSVAVPTRAKDEILSLLKALAHGYVIRHSVRVAGVGSYGEVDAKRGLVLESRTNPDWEGVDLRRELKEVGLQHVAVANDVTVAALGAYAMLKPAPSSLAFLMFGTGVGLGVVRSGHPVGLDNPLFGSIGRLPAPSGRTISEACGGRGIEERYAAERRTSGRVAASEVFELAEVGDQPAREVVREAVDAATVVFRWLLAACDADMIYVGGGVWVHSSHFREAVLRAVVPAFLTSRAIRGRIRTARGMWYGAQGGALLAQAPSLGGF